MAKQEQREGVQQRQVFHVLPENPCPYLPGQKERKLFTDLTAPGGRRLYDLLSQGGFRRSHLFAYRPACSGCSACVPVRVDVAAFQPSSSQRRIWQRSSDLVAVEQPARATLQQYRLFDRYVRARHGDGDMAAMTWSDFQAMVEDTVLDTRLVEFRHADGALQAAALVDWLADGPSAVYSFFAPEEKARSLGSFMILWMIHEAQRRGLPYVYLGYWIEASRKMSYKARFQPLQGFVVGAWCPL